MPKMNVTDVARIAAVAARQESPDLHVVGVTFNSGGSDYVEVVLDIHGCGDEPCQLVVGVFRNVGEQALQAEIAEKLRHHLREHRP